MTLEHTHRAAPRPVRVPDGPGARHGWRIGAPVRHADGPADTVETYCRSLWGDMVWPAALWQILAHADAQGIGLATRREVSDLPRRLYNGLDDLTRAVRTLRAATR